MKKRLICESRAGNLIMSLDDSDRGTIYREVGTELVWMGKAAFDLDQNYPDTIVDVPHLNTTGLSDDELKAVQKLYM